MGRIGCCWFRNGDAVVAVCGSMGREGARQHRSPGSEPQSTLLGAVGGAVFGPPVAVAGGVGESGGEFGGFFVADESEGVDGPAGGGRIGRPMALRQETAERGGSRGATAGPDRAGCGRIVEVPRCFLSTLKAGFVSSAQTGLETALLAGRRHRGMECRQRLWMSIAGSSSGDV